MILCSNYAPGIVPQMEAQKKGCQQILWLYGDDYKVTEAGTMNCFMFWENKQGGRCTVTPKKKKKLVAQRSDNSEKWVEIYKKPKNGERGGELYVKLASKRTFPIWRSWNPSVVKLDNLFRESNTTKFLGVTVAPTPTGTGRDGAKEPYGGCKMELVTPDLDGTILPGVTRISILELVREWGEFKVTERSFTMQELLEGLKENRVKEVFGAGTACVVCPVGQILFKGEMYEIPTMKDGAPLASRLLKTLNDIQYGRIKSPWAVDIEDLAEEEEGIRRKAR
ncbi:putative branched-chain-amino-acid aminotransferase, cytosolic-like [Apostichopus japonicus]|uniref:Putative branched-chain-amino-acid aminotransferase, cytosolic-like n=1 Tax=Stichopus japonicus TaxID=307972 RepID=A0A2G8KL55_STIJA|nr:putative branched-chain-amino-acid aminotransferase, cytosolic-like [Apostichopus japonicus]